MDVGDRVSGLVVFSPLLVVRALAVCESILEVLLVSEGTLQLLLRF